MFLQHYLSNQYLHNQKLFLHKVFNTKRNFEVFKAIDFIANLTQHIPEKSFQLVRYYGWYSNKKRGMHKQQKIKNEENNNSIPTGIDIIDISDHTSKKVPSKKWRELIKKIWEVDPLICPECGSEMKMIALIDDDKVIEKILRHLKIWEDPEPARAPPEIEYQEIIAEPIYDDFEFCPEDYPGDIMYG